MSQNKYRLGLDIGTTSIGWCALKLDGKDNPCGILGMGVRIFSSGRDPKKGTSLAEDRRLARGMRRNRDRALLRKRDLMEQLIANGLMPTEQAKRKELERLCPYELRDKGIKEKLSLHELGRALFHLQQRRGFKSNRITDKGGDESGTIKVSIKQTRAKIPQGSTYGVYLAQRHKNREGVRARLRGSTQKDKSYDIYADRELIEDEFNTLWNAQKKYHPKALTDKAHQALHDIFFRQRDLRPVEPGKCRLDPTQPRAPQALPITQHFRIAKEVNNLYWYDSRQEKHDLALDEKQKLITMLLEKKEVTFKAMKKALGIEDPEAYFNLESDKRKSLKGDEVAYALAKVYGKEWRGLDPKDQNCIVKVLLDHKLSDVEAKKILGKKWNIDEDMAEKLLTVKLPDKYSHYSEKILTKLTPMMESQGLNEYDAIIAADYTLPQEYDNKALLRLPYYGRVVPSAVIGATNNPEHDEIRYYGKINNPTVHIGLNQLRKLINALVKDKHFGKPEQVIVEFARELKKSWEERREIENQQTENQKKNDERNKKIRELGFKPNGANRMRMRLWEEADRKCIYTGKVIPLHKLFGKEREIEDDHILPFSKTLDNSANNRLVCYSYANQEKGNRSPYEAFGNLSHSAKYDGGWDGILERASQLNKYRSKRFAPDAMERYEDKERDFIDRQLHDTAYLAKIAKGYLGKLYDNPLQHVWVTPGQMTALLRGKWGLNNPLGDNQFKDRNDHRHHAIDAFVIAATSRSMLQKVSTQTGKSGSGRLIDDMPPPWEGYRDQFIQRFKKVVISHKPDHSIEAQLHNETAYGKIKAPPGTTESYNYVVRKNITDLTEGEVARIQDKEVQDDLTNYLAKSGKPYKDALKDFVDEDKQPGRVKNPKPGQKPYVKKVRIHLPNKGGTPPPLIPIEDKQGKPYKYYDRGKNCCVDVYENEDGSIYAYTYSIFEANQLSKQGKWDTKHPHPLPRAGKKPLMRVYKGDCLKVTIDGDTQIVKVQKLNPSAKRFFAVSHTDAGAFDKRVKDDDDAFKWIFINFNNLKKYQARKVRVDMLGRVYHVQPPKEPNGG